MALPRHIPAAGAGTEQLASIAEATSDLAVIGSPDGSVAWMNAACRSILGFGSEEDLSAYRIEDLFPATEMARVYDEVMPALVRDGDWQGEWTMLSRDGTEIPLLANQHLHHDARGEHSYVSCIMRDLRPQRTEERAQREGALRLATAETVAGLGSWQWDPETNLVMWSPGMYRLHGMEPGNGEATLQDWLDTVHPEDRQRALRLAEEGRTSGDGVDFVYRAVRVDGSTLVIHTRGELVPDPSGHGPSMLVGTLLDITERHAASEALRESEERARRVIETAGDAYIQCGADGLVTEWNGQAEATFGWSRDEALGRSLPSLVLAPEDRESFEQQVGLREHPGGGAPAHARFELSMVHRSGREIRAEVTPWTVRAGGDEVFSCFVRDVGDLRALERAKDEFVSVVGHELRTPLTSIHGVLGLLRAGLLGELNDRGRQMVEIAAHNTDRLVRLINDILDIERLNSGTVTLQRSVCDLAEITQRTLDAMRPMAEGAAVRLEMDARPSPVLADADRLEQTVTNLLSNAIKFSPAGTTVRLTACRHDDEVELRVCDEGRGIPPEDLDRVFGRFQQVDASDARQKGGTGLGLAICRTIVEQHGGRIWAENGSGGGAVLVVRLPADVPSGHPQHLEGPKVLICGREVAARDTVAGLLRSHGYETVDLASGDALLEAATTHRPDVVLLDLRMPVTDSWQAAATLRERAETRDIPVVVLGLHGQHPDVGGNVAASRLEEPFDADALFDAVEAAVSSRTVGPTLLLVEDDEGLAHVLMERFRHLGIDVHHAPTAQRALEKCGSVAPDLLVLDLMLPDRDGFSVVAELRRDDRLRGMPLVVYTARDLSAEDRGRLHLGRTEFFTKSRVTPEDFERHVLHLMAQLTDTAKERIHD